MTRSVDLWGCHQVPVIGDGYVFELVDPRIGVGFSIRVWGECGGIANPYISIKTEYLSPAGGLELWTDDGVGILSHYAILSQNHESHQNIFGGVSISADFSVYLELTTLYIDELGEEVILSQVSIIRYGEFHCEHERSIFE